MDQTLVEQAVLVVRAFCRWLDRHGEISYDHQSFYAGTLGRTAKGLYYRSRLLGTLAVAPIVFCEAFMPGARRFFWKAQRFPIADSHYAMGFAFLAQIYGKDEYYQRAVHFLEVLKETRCPGYEQYCWGYPFDWQTRTGVIVKGTPLITTVPYVYEAFSQVYMLDHKQRWLRTMRSIAEHAFGSYRDVETAPDSASCGYTPAPDDPTGVVNASAYRAFLLIKAGIDLSAPLYLRIGKRNLNFVLSSQNEDGSWYYSTDGTRDFIDHFHTCFVLKALVKIEELTGSSECGTAIKRGLRYYVNNLVDGDGLPLPFSKAPRLTIYRRELYDYAECINMSLLLGDRYPDMDRILCAVVTDLISRWQKSDGSFRSRKLLVGWDNTPMHRWAQAQVFRSLCFLISRSCLSAQGRLVLSQSSHIEC
jgi:hypothetical protein